MDRYERRWFDALRWALTRGNFRLQSTWKKQLAAKKHKENKELRWEILSRDHRAVKQMEPRIRLNKHRPSDAKYDRGPLSLADGQASANRALRRFHDLPRTADE